MGLLRRRGAGATSGSNGDTASSRRALGGGGGGECLDVPECCGSFSGCPSSSDVLPAAPRCECCFVSRGEAMALGGGGGAFRRPLGGGGGECLDMPECCGSFGGRSSSSDVLPACASRCDCRGCFVCRTSLWRATAAVPPLPSARDDDDTGDTDGGGGAATVPSSSREAPLSAQPLLGDGGLAFAVELLLPESFSSFSLGTTICMEPIFFSAIS
mmetsp:Transcript_38074/g.91844  ORF Transcript_38074/g.91844 Transcript_38074/m.91844 type:complete len:214 (-) Transcript_38074:603-1244(-)